MKTRAKVVFKKTESPTIPVYQKKELTDSNEAKSKNSKQKTESTTKFHKEEITSSSEASTTYTSSQVHSPFLEVKTHRNETVYIRKQTALHCKN